MNVVFKKVNIHNFMSFSDAELELDNRGYVLITGVNNNPDDLARSNGSGKSAIGESIIWALTGETIRGTKDIVNKNIPGGTFVDLDFELDNKNYNIVRYKDHDKFGTNLKFIIDGEDKSGKGIRDTEKIINDFLPDLNTSLISSVIILGQGLPQRFTNNSPIGRKEVLEKLSKSDFMILDIKDKLYARKIQLSNDLRELEDKLLSETTKKEILANNLQKLNDNKLQLIPEDFDKLASDIKSKVLNFTNDLDCLNIELSSINIDINKFQQEAQAYLNEFNLEQSNLKDKFNIKNQDFISKKIEFDLKSKNIFSEFTRLESIKDICPTCGQHLPNVHKIDTTDLHNEYNTLIEQITLNGKEINNNNIQLNEELVISKKNYDLKSSDIKQKLDDINIKRDLLTNRINNIQCEINSNKLAIESINLRKSNYYNQINNIDSDILKTQEDLNKISSEILYNNIERDKVLKHSEIVNKLSTIASRDFRGFLLSNIIDFIDAQAKQSAINIFGHNKIEFKLDGNNIYIGYCDKQYENLSGGERQKVDIIVQFAIRDMLSKFLNFSSNILIVDEIFDNLDSISCQKVIDLISNKLYDISSIFIITHHESDLSIPYDREIIIGKGKDGISKVI